MASAIVGVLGWTVATAISSPMEVTAAALISPLVCWYIKNRYTQRIENPTARTVACALGSTSLTSPVIVLLGTCDIALSTGKRAFRLLKASGFVIQVSSRRAYDTMSTVMSGTSAAELQDSRDLADSVYELQPVDDAEAERKYWEDWEMIPRSPSPAPLPMREHFEGFEILPSDSEEAASRQKALDDKAVDDLCDSILRDSDCVVTVVDLQTSSERAVTEDGGEMSGSFVIEDREVAADMLRRLAHATPTDEALNVNLAT